MKRIKVTKELIEQLRPFWKKLQFLEDVFLLEVAELEAKMAQETGIEDIMFFAVDGEYVGIGNYNPKRMRLIHDCELMEFKQGLEGLEELEKLEEKEK